MELETEKQDGGTSIKVTVEKDVAVSVISGSEEVIYLPSDGSDSGYYTEGSSVIEQDEGFTVFHNGPVDSVEILG